jgi:septal ring factor EnvC (AmiA/AmiB activator)
MGAVLPSSAATSRSAGSEPERRVEEFERRVAHLEKRLEEMAEVKDRIERQLATQNEELRVQRAAIARTQRVLRNLSRPEDAATEPAFKGPGSQPPEGVR